VKRIPRLLDAADARVLGALLEKEQTTPDLYPLTLNALVAACNQKTAREPVMELSEDAVRAALKRLFEDVLVWRAEGARATRWRQSVDRRWELEPATKAVITLLLLRGPQTPGELRSRSDRLHEFASVEAVEEALQKLGVPPEPLVRELPRAPGQKEARWAHLLSGEPAQSPAGEVPGARAIAWEDDRPDLAARVAALEDRLAEVEARLRDGILKPSSADDGIRKPSSPDDGIRPPSAD
jgi:uncharacterized protein YceH (UPF0502 family)